MNRDFGRAVRSIASTSKSDLRPLTSKPRTAEAHGERARQELARVLPMSDLDTARLDFLMARVMGERESLRRALETAIAKITMRFDEALQEYETAGKASDESKWKGEMIAYANVVGMLEKLRKQNRD